MFDISTSKILFDAVFQKMFSLKMYSVPLPNDPWYKITIFSTNNDFLTNTQFSVIFSKSYMNDRMWGKFLLHLFISTIN